VSRQRSLSASGKPACGLTFLGMGSGMFGAILYYTPLSTFVKDIKQALIYPLTCFLVADRLIL
jgi:hypothetical protein